MSTQTTSRVKKWGNSLAVRIPASVAQDLGLSENSTIQISSNGTTASIKPKTVKKSLNELINQINPDNKHSETNWGEPVGKEAW